MKAFQNMEGKSESVRHEAAQFNLKLASFEYAVQRHGDDGAYYNECLHTVQKHVLWLLEREESAQKAYTEIEKSIDALTNKVIPNIRAERDAYKLALDLLVDRLAKREER